MVGSGHGKVKRKEKDEPERILSRGGIGAMVPGALVGNGEWRAEQSAWSCIEAVELGSHDGRLALFHNASGSFGL